MMMTEGVRLSAWWRLRVILFECYLTFRIWNPGSKEYLDHAEQPGGLTKLREPILSRSEAQNLARYLHKWVGHRELDINQLKSDLKIQDHAIDLGAELSLPYCPSVTHLLNQSGSGAYLAPTQSPEFPCS